MSAEQLRQARRLVKSWCPDGAEGKVDGVWVKLDPSDRRALRWSVLGAASKVGLDPSGMVEADSQDAAQAFYDAEIARAELAEEAAARAAYEPKLNAFLADLERICDKHGFGISGCGCCGSPTVLEAPGPHKAKVEVREERGDFWAEKLDV